MPKLCLKGDVRGLCKSDTGIANERCLLEGRIYVNDLDSKAKAKEQNGCRS